MLFTKEMEHKIFSPYFFQIIHYVWWVNSTYISPKQAKKKKKRGDVKFAHYFAVADSETSLTLFQNGEKAMNTNLDGSISAEEQVLSRHKCGFLSLTLVSYVIL